MQALMLLYSILVRSFESKIVNIFNIFNEFIILIIFLYSICMIGSEKATNRQINIQNDTIVYLL